MMFFILFVLALFSYPLIINAQVDCIMCHEPITKEKHVHPAVTMGCQICHTAIDAKDIPHKKTNKIAKGLSSEQPELCFGCHDRAIFTKKTQHPALLSGCTSCHNPHSSKNPKILNSEIPTICLNCHDRKGFEGKIIHPPAMGGMCLSCHNPHSTDTQRLLMAETPQLCYNCHDSKKFTGKFIHAPVAGGMCTNCHFPHKSENEKLLQANTPDLCFNCHDKAEFNKKNIHAPVAAGACSSCHNPHATNFTAQLNKRMNDLCIDCHSEPEIKNGVHIIRGFTTAGHPVKAKVDKKRPNKEFNCSSCHTPHSSEWIDLFRYKANSLFELCTHCHQR